jgi:hypothetical protein
LARRSLTSATPAKVVIGIAVALVLGMTILCCCCCCAHEPEEPEPTPQELANEVGVLRARVQMLEEERVLQDERGAGVALPVEPPPTYTPHDREHAT